MKVFKFITTDTYAIAAPTFDEALEHFQEIIAGEYDEVEEIYEDKWDEKFITIYEDNDTSTEPFKISIRESMCGTETMLVYSTDNCLIGW